MTDETANLVLEQLRAIRAEQAQTNLKIGTLAESMIAMRKQIDELRGDVDALRRDVHSIRSDIRMIAIAVDQHTARLDRIEVRLNLHDA